VVEKERTKLNEATASLQQLKEQQTKIEKM